jgi:hypothetical protein
MQIEPETGIRTFEAARDARPGGRRIATAVI